MTISSISVSTAFECSFPIDNTIIYYSKYYNYHENMTSSEQVENLIETIYRNNETLEFYSPIEPSRMSSRNLKSFNILRCLFEFGSIEQNFVLLHLNDLI